jgi:hypothetical protein
LPFRTGEGRSLTEDAYGLPVEKIVREVFIVHEENQTLIDLENDGLNRLIA